MKMKTLLACLIGLIIACSACKSSQGHCDAYGNKSTIEEQQDYDIHSSHNQSMSKYVTATSIK